MLHLKLSIEEVTCKCPLEKNLLSSLGLKEVYIDNIEENILIHSQDPKHSRNLNIVYPLRVSTASFLKQESWAKDLQYAFEF